ncbi:MAG: hypothetical protein K8T10_03905 [Candidatus Eremiobacteraeota bacterium]|nr:hypothetical protein [Candidatus Eremiobacteraeota bacterium]
MDIGKVQGSMTQNFTGKARKAPAKGMNVSDAFKRGSKSEQLDADKMQSLKSGKAKKSWGKKEAKGLLGIGVMMGGIMASVAIGGPFAPALMIGAMFGGLAIMAL